MKDNLKKHLTKGYVGGGPFRFDSIVTDDQFQQSFTDRYYAVKNEYRCTLTGSGSKVWISLSQTDTINAFFDDLDTAIVKIDDTNNVFIPDLQIRYEKQDACVYGRLFWHYYVRRLTNRGQVFDSWN